MRQSSMINRVRDSPTRVNQVPEPDSEPACSGQRLSQCNININNKILKYYNKIVDIYIHKNSEE